MLGSKNKYNVKKKNTQIVDVEVQQLVQVNHISGCKRVIFTSTDCDSSVTQIAIGYLSANQFVEEHQHPCMEEFFYFQSGEGLFVINGESFRVYSNTIVRVPVGAKHHLVAKTSLTFFYFGIAI